MQILHLVMVKRPATTQRQSAHVESHTALQRSRTKWDLCSSKACSALTDHTRKDFVLLAQHVPIDIIHVSAHHGDMGNEFADLLANMARTCVAERCWTLVERCQDPMYSRSFVSSSQEACHHCYSQCSHHAPCASSGFGSFPFLCPQTLAFTLF